MGPCRTRPTGGGGGRRATPRAHSYEHPGSPRWYSAANVDSLTPHRDPSLCAAEAAVAAVAAAAAAIHVHCPRGVAAAIPAGNDLAAARPGRSSER